MKDVTLRAYVATNWNTVTTVFDIYTKPGLPGSGNYRELWARVRVDNNGGPPHTCDVRLAPAFVAALRPKTAVHDTTRLPDNLVVAAFYEARDEHHIAELRRRHANLAEQAATTVGETRARAEHKAVMVEQILEDFFGVTP